jgi:hypothetical protein
MVYPTFDGWLKPNEQARLINRYQIRNQYWRRACPLSFSHPSKTGDTLAPFLFIIVMDYIISQIPNEFDFIANTLTNDRLNILAFADDIVLINKFAKEALTHLKIIRREAREVGLKININ